MPNIHRMSRINFESMFEQAVDCIERDASLEVMMDPRVQGPLVDRVGMRVAVGMLRGILEMQAYTQGISICIRTMYIHDIYPDGGEEDIEKIMEGTRAEISQDRDANTATMQLTMGKSLDSFRSVALARAGAKDSISICLEQPEVLEAIKEFKP